MSPHATAMPSMRPEPWVPSRYRVPASRVIWQRGAFRLHESAVRLLVVSALLAVVPTLAGAVVDPALGAPAFVAVGCALAWAFTISFLHHELAHAAVARRHGVRTLAVGFHGNGAYVRFRRSSTPVPPRVWARILAAGPLSNLTAGTGLLMAHSLVDDRAFGLFCLVAGAAEMVWAIATGVPIRHNDGREVMDAVRLAH